MLLKGKYSVRQLQTGSSCRQPSFWRWILSCRQKIYVVLPAGLFEIRIEEEQACLKLKECAKCRVLILALMHLATKGTYEPKTNNRAACGAGKH
jgi:hypothetical protein